MKVGGKENQTRIDGGKPPPPSGLPDYRRFVTLAIMRILNHRFASSLTSIILTRGYTTASLEYTDGRMACHRNTLDRF